MRIERVNESTVKFFMTYSDIEDRGFKQDDIWTNRKKGEEFFWSIMEEVNREEEFVIEGPLWIQVHAFDKGIEFVVTKSKDDNMMYLPDEVSDDQLENHVNDFLNRAIDEDSELMNLLNDKHAHRTATEVIAEFKDLENIIQFSYSYDFIDINMEDLLYMYDGKYYYYVHFDLSMTEDEMDAFVANLFEYAEDTKISHAMLEEYGKIVMSHNVRNQIKKHFTR